jgi:NADP-dependent 3-hydroxy acid dehydrogenase YdfG
VRVSALEPAAVATELFPPEVRRRHRAEHGACGGLGSEDVADAIGYIVTRPRHVVVGELLVCPTAQERSP